MIYIVSGWQRTGTSMMMEALEAGGMNAAYSTEKDDLLAKKFQRMTGTVPNERYYELDKADYRKDGFPADFEGKLIKVLYGGIPKLNDGLQYRVIYMRRPQRDVCASLSYIWGQKGIGNAGRPNWEQRQEKAVAWMRDRPGQFLSVDEIWYDDVLKDPYGTFKRLALDGWPIDPVKAAAIPDKKTARHTTQEGLASAV